MKKNALSLLLVLCTLLCACGSKSAYADDLPCAELSDAMEDQIPVDFGYETFGRDHIRYYFEDTELPDDLCLRYSVRSEDINEVGIFHAPDEAAREEIKALSQRYLEELRRDQSAFIASYAPEELPKLERAEVKVFGNYVVYAILSDSDRELVFDTIEKKLMK